MTGLFIKSFFAGIMLGIPAGPIGAVALRRMLLKDPRHGFFFAMGFGMVDIIYSLLVGVGVYAVADFFVKYDMILYVGGTFFFFIMGISVFFSKFELENNKGESGKEFTYGSSVFLAFVLALFSPATFFAFSATFAGLQLGFQFDQPLRAVLTVGGVFMGGCVWWGLLTILAHKCRHRISQRISKHINHFFGVMILLLACIYLFVAVMKI